MPPCLKSVGFALALIGAGAIAPFVPSLNPQAQVYAQTQTVSPSAERSLQLATQQFKAGDYPAAEASLKQALGLYQKAQNRSEEAQVLTQLGELYNWSNRGKEAVPILQTALKLRQDLKDRQGEGSTLHQLGEAYGRAEEPQKSVETLQQALTLQREIGDRTGEGRTLVTFGAFQFLAGQIKPGLDATQKAQVLLQDDRTWRSLAESWTGWIQVNMGNASEGMVHLDRGLKLSLEAGDRGAEWTARYFIAEAYYQQKNYAKALEFYQQVLPIAQKARLQESEVYMLKAIGNMHRWLKKPAEAMPAYQAALKITQDLKEPASIAEIHNLIGLTYYETEQYPPAIAAFQQALVGYQKGSNRPADIALVQANLGDAYRDSAQYPKALESYQQALAAYQDLRDRAKAVNVLKKIAVNYRELKQPEIAIKTYEQAIALYQKTQTTALLPDDLIVIGELHNRIGVIYSNDLKDHALAALAYQRALTAYQKNNNQAANIAQVWSNLGNAHSNLQEYSKALEAYQRSLSLYRQISDVANEARLLSNLSGIYRQLGQTDRAIQTHQEARKKNQSGIASETDQTVSTTQDLNLDGTWQISSAKTTKNQPYTGTVTFSRVKQRYGLLWETSIGLRSGIAIVEDGQLFIGWGEGTDSSHGLIVYRIGQDGSLNGKWAEGADGTGTEKATGGKPGHVEGDYKVVGKNYDGSSYNGKLRIQQTGGTYQLVWDTGTEYRGIGIRVGNHLVAGWSSSGLPGAAAYEVKGDRLVGQLASLNQTQLITETLVFNPVTTHQNQQKITAMRLQVESGNLWEEGQQKASIAKLQNALVIARSLKDRNLEATVLQKIGMSYGAQEQFLSALKYHKLALKIYRALASRRELATILTLMGVIYDRQGQYTQSRGFYQQSLVLHRTLGDRESEGTALANIGKSYTQQGQYTQGLALLEKALTLHRTQGNRAGEGATLNNMGACHLCSK